MKVSHLGCGIGLLCLAAMAGAQGPGARSDDDMTRRLQRMMSGGPMMDPPQLAEALTRAAAFPLGSDNNPVRAESPSGQRQYLSRLRCADGHAPEFSRVGNVGPGVFESIVDDYIVDCAASAPGQVHVKMDMYFKGYVEARPVPGFTIMPSVLPALPASLPPVTQAPLQTDHPAKKTVTG